MDKGYLFLFFIFVLASISTFFFMRMSRNVLKGKLDILKITFFFFSGYSFLMSAVKWYIGNREDTLIESLWDSNGVTYIHYGIPLMIAGIVASIVLVTLLKSIAENFVKAFDAYFFLGILSAMFLCGSISNTAFCLVYLICLIFSLLTALVYKKKLVYVVKSEYKKTFISTLPYIGAACFMNGVFLPNELYLNNVNEFACPYGEFFFILFVGSLLITFLFIMFSMLLLPKFLYKGMKLVIAGIAIMGYVQTMFLNARLESMDGRGQNWSMQIRIVNLIIWLVVVCVVGIAGFYKSEIEKFIKVACIYIILIQVVTLGYLIITTEHGDSQISALTTEGSLELGTDKNVIVFVLDRFDSIWMEELIEEDSDFCKPLSDFVYYRNATSQFAHTGTALPYMLTGVDWSEEEIGDGSYSEYAYENGVLLERLQQNNYNIGIYTSLGYLSDAVYGMADNYREKVDISCNISKTIELMWKSSMYKMTPFILKSAYEYYSGDMTQMEKTDEIWNIDNDLPFYDNLIENVLTVVDEYQNAFRFYHMRGAHHPYYLSEDLQYNKSGRDVTVHSQIRGCLNIVYEYLEQMKKLGIYDKATIIITADHGQQVEFVAEQNKPDRVSMPVMLVKESDKKGDSLQISSVPVSQAELIPTIVKAMGMDWTEYGRTFDEIDEEEREREYLDIYKDYFIKYTINGDAKELDNWRGVAIK